MVLLRRHAVVLWSTLLALLVLGPALGPGYVLSYDMVWVPDLTVRRDLLGLGSGLPRAVPSDLVVAVVDEVVPGMVLQKAVLVASLGAAGCGAARLAPRGLVPGLVAATVAVWNPYVVERLVLGHWPVLVGYAVLPWVVLDARAWRVSGRLSPRLLLLVPLGCLSAGAGLVTALAVLAFAAGPRRTSRALLLVAAGNAPWAVAGLLHSATATTDSVGASVFALQDQGGLPGPVAALGLGGIWNSEVVPASATGVAGAAGVLVLVGLALLGARSWWDAHGREERRGYLLCWAAGWLLALATWAAPDAVGWVVAHIPGTGVVRDGARFLALCAPLLAVAAAHGAARLRRHGPVATVPRVALAAALVLAPVAVLPGAAWGVGSRLGTADYPDAWASGRTAVSEAVAQQPGDVLLLPLSSYRQPSWNDHRKVLDPLGRYLTPDYVAYDELVVSGVVVAGEDPRARRAAAALDLPTPAQRAVALARLGIAVVAIDPGAPGPVPDVEGRSLVDAPTLRVLALADPADRDVPRSWVVLMAVAWLAWLSAPAATLLLALRSRRRAG